MSSGTKIEVEQFPPARMASSRRPQPQPDGTGLEAVELLDDTSVETADAGRATSPFPYGIKDDAGRGVFHPGFTRPAGQEPEPASPDKLSREEQEAKATLARIEREREEQAERARRVAEERAAEQARIAPLKANYTAHLDALGVLLDAGKLPDREWCTEALARAQALKDITGGNDTAFQILRRHRVAPAYTQLVAPLIGLVTGQLLAPA
jgi:hypothetical protein